MVLYSPFVVWDGVSVVPSCVSIDSVVSDSCSVVVVGDAVVLVTDDIYHRHKQERRT